MNLKLTRPAWIEVNLDKLSHNIREITNQVTPGTQIMAIVKSDAYEMGAIQIVKKLISLGIHYYGVATLSEALSLRRYYDNINLLILGYNPEYLMKETVENNIISTIYTLDSAKKLNDIAASMNQIARIHIAIDTGMRRIGFIPSQKSFEEILQIKNLSNVSIEGAFTHFPASESDMEFTKKQFQEFVSFTDQLKNSGLNVGLRHVSNSHATLNYREFDLDMIRPGIIMYGSTDGCDFSHINLKFIAEVKAHIAHVKTIPAGESISYERNYFTKKETQVVTLPLGYTDGFPRILSGKIYALIKGKKCPQVGNICMDQMMVDATGVECKEGDEAVLIGSQGEEEIKLSEICKHSGDIETSYLTHFNKRLPIVYIDEGKMLRIEDNIYKL